MTAERRHWPRDTLKEGIAVTVTADGGIRPGRLLDVGRGGAAVRLEGAAPLNFEVRIEHPAAGYLYATRAWAAPGVIGVAFDSRTLAMGFLALCEPQATPLLSA